MLRAVQREVEEYLNTPGLYSEGENFPNRVRMTGAYYISSESYIAHRDPAWFQISIKCHFLEHPKAGVATDAAAQSGRMLVLAEKWRRGWAQPR
jgi:hypothetical protein